MPTIPVNIYSPSSVSSTKRQNVVDAMDNLASQVNYDVNGRVAYTSYSKTIDCNNWSGTLQTFEDWLENDGRLYTEEHYMLLSDKDACDAGGIYNYHIGQKDGQNVPSYKYSVSFIGVDANVDNYQNTAIQEFCHTIMDDVDGDCPDSNHPEHSCGRVYDDPYTSDTPVSPMLSGYVELAQDQNWSVCNNLDWNDGFTDQISDCTKTHTETYVDHWL